MKIIAWYSHKIPYPFGPKEYFGLPGVILELHEAIKDTVRFSFTAEKIIPKQNKGVDFDFPKNVKVMIEEDFNIHVIGKNEPK